MTPEGGYALHRIGQGRAGASRGQMLYMPGLDGLRAISIGLVIFAHAGLGHIVPGGLGVTVFFVISGFLITNLMIAEIFATGTLSLKEFYLRRMFRLLPALLVYIVLMTPVTVALGAHVTVPMIVAAIFYAANYWQIYVGFPGNTPFSTLWSLSVEEHYYVFFPLIMAFFVTRIRQLIAIIVVAGLIALLWRFCLQRACESGSAVWALCGTPQTPDMPDGVRIYMGTDTRYDSILSGAFLALVAANWKRFDKWKMVIFSNQAMVTAVSMLILSLVIRNPTFRDTARYTVQNIAIAVVIGNVVFHNRSIVKNTLSFVPLVFIGRLSYSLYLYHFTSLIMVHELYGDDTRQGVGLLLFLVTTMLFALASYYLVERPMIKFRRRFGSHAPA